LFGGIGPVESLRLKYDKMGRSDGVAYVTYSSIADANEAIRKFNGANAAGQPITVTLDADVTPRRPAPGPVNPRPRGARGFGRGGSRPMGGRMAGGGERGGPRGSGERRENKPRRTQEELDKELDDFMSGPPPADNGNNDGAEAANGEAMALD
jgi:THO complex subunit 4